jgi:restriction system protein
MATYLDAAVEILEAANQQLHYEEITRQALAQKLITPQGLTPEATMASRLYTDSKQEGSRFVRAGHGRFGLASWQPVGIDAQVKLINHATRKQLATYLHSMPPERFEALIGELLIQMGFDESTVTVTRRSGDGGIDVVGTYRAAGLTEVSAAVQVKRWKNNIQAPVITSLRGSIAVNQQGIIITTSDFSKGAQVEAAAANRAHIGLINGEELLDLLIKHKVGVVEKTLTVIGLDDEWWSDLSGEAEAEEVAPTVSEETPHPSGDKGPAGHKPTSFTLLGHTYGADTWRGVLLGVCSQLAKLHGEQFGPTAATVRGKKRQHLADSPDGMINPAQIPGTSLWLETNQSATSALRVIRRLMVATGHQEQDFSVSFE